MGRRSYVLLVAIPIGIAGCGILESVTGGGRADYKNTARGQSLEVPPDLTRPGRDDRYVIPDSPTGSASGATLSAYNAERGTPIRPGSTEVLPINDRVRVERLGSERWLVVNDNAEKIWPLVRQFWLDNGFVLKVDDPGAGVLETDWHEHRAQIPNDGIRSILSRTIGTLYSTGERDLYRTRLERGADGKSTEIYVSHRGMVEQIVNSQRGNEGTIWQPRNPDVQREAEFLRRLMVRFGVDEERAKTQLPVVAGAERAKLVNPNDGPSEIVLDEPFDRAWRRVGVALDRSGFTVVDRDRTKGYYFVRYADPRDDQPQERPGFFSRIFGGGDSRQISAEQFRVMVRGGSGESSQVQVLDKVGAADASSTAKRILNVLHAQLK